MEPISASAGKSANGRAKTIQPPMKGYAIQYEKLLLEEVDLRKSRADLLKSEQSRAHIAALAEDSSRGTRDGRKKKRKKDDLKMIRRIERLKIRGLFHRAALEGMLIAGQCASDKVSEDPSCDFEPGLERKDAKNALAALWDVKSRQLEEEDNKLPFIYGASSSRRRRHKAKSQQNTNFDPAEVEIVEADVDSFFQRYPHCKREDTPIHGEGQGSAGDVGSTDCLEVKPPAGKTAKYPTNSSENDTATASSPLRTSLSDQYSSASAAPPPSVSDESKVLDRKQPQQREQRMRQNHHSSTSSRESSSYSRVSSRDDIGISHTLSEKRHKDVSLSHQFPTNQYAKNRPARDLTQLRQHQRHSTNYSPNQYTPHQNGTEIQTKFNSCAHNASNFDYSESTAMRDTSERNGFSGKANPFRTAKELGNDFDSSSQGDKTRDGDAWKDYRSNYNNVKSVNGRFSEKRRCGWGNANADVVEINDDDMDTGNGNHRRLGGIHRSSPGPQQLVRAAIRGPKDNLSAGLKRKFQPPMRKDSGAQGNGSNGAGVRSANSARSTGGNEDVDDELPEELRGLDKELIEKINNEIVDSGEKVTFDDIAGLADAKQTVLEMVCWPMKRPDLFTGLRRCPNGLLLFGPPGTGKTLIGKAIAHESGATFFSISSSSLTSKWIGEGEKLVRTLFAVASYRSPSVVFIDEVDSMLTQRKSDENEASRRIKTEFLVQLDGAGNGNRGQVLVIGATNRPQELDDAARRRFVKRLYVPLPTQPDREILLRTLLDKNSHSLTEKEIAKLSHDTAGFSGADLKNLCTDAAMGPIRQLGARAMDIDAKDIPPISYRHFRQSLRGTSPSVAQTDLEIYIEWNNTYGSRNSNGADADSDDCSDDNSHGEAT